MTIRFITGLYLTQKIEASNIVSIGVATSQVQWRRKIFIAFINHTRLSGAVVFHLNVTTQTKMFTLVTQSSTGRTYRYKSESYNVRKLPN